MIDVKEIDTIELLACLGQARHLEIMTLGRQARNAIELREALQEILDLAVPRHLRHDDTTQTGCAVIRAQLLLKRIAES